MKRLALYWLGHKPQSKLAGLCKMIEPPYPSTSEAVKDLDISEPTLRKYSEIVTYSEIIKMKEELENAKK